MPRVFCVLLAFMLGTTLLRADGVELTPEHRFTEGVRTTLSLTSAQMATLNASRASPGRLQHMKLLLTTEQTRRLQAVYGFTVTELMVFEGPYGDCSCCAWNIATRYTPERIEVSSHYLRPTLAVRIERLAIEISIRRRVHWWQFWRPRVTDFRNAQDRARRQILKQEGHERNDGHGLDVQSHGD